MLATKSSAYAILSSVCSRLLPPFESVVGKRRFLIVFNETNGTNGSFVIFYNGAL